ncbi:unnamed protein product [Allacma fusca]|uniref:Chitin-binding type-2 domain-containing protein n=1 Tax=Allacma fusca TaxID=39272 RepID=A0A8J2PXK6_9HEXA|nr:unnamed protein product [Allacma fusca]
MKLWTLGAIFLWGLGNLSEVSSCQVGIQYFRGLMPLRKQEYTGNDTNSRACNYFWSCPYVPGDSVKKMYDCRDSDPAKPYFSVNTCSCVETDHEADCEDNEIKPYNCGRTFKVGDEPEETCQKFGPEPVSYIERFPNLNDPQRFWYCRPQNATHTIADNCPWTNSYNPDVIWNQRDCSHIELENNNDTEIIRGEILAFNNHPLNRFKCSEPYNPNISVDNCEDRDGMFYVGNFANPGYDKSIYYQCVKNEGFWPAAIPVKQKCPENQLFDIDSCFCVDPENFKPCANYNPSNEKICATVVGSNPCIDENGLFRKGQIPHELYCNKFWNCGSNLIPYLTNCPGITVFDVLHATESGCACSQPKPNICEENWKPENKYRCASEIIDTK